MKPLPAPPPRFLYRLANGLRQLLIRLTRRMVPAPVALYEQLTGVWLTEMIFVMARLGIADHLAAGPRSAEELVGLTGANAGALPRLLRALAAIGFLARGSDGRYALTRLSSVLRTDAPNSMRDIALYGGSLHSMHAWCRFLDVVKTGTDGYELAHGKSLFDYLGQNQDEAVIFDGAMVCMTRLEAPALVHGYDYSGFRSICDVGGGRGFMLGAILAANPKLEGVLFDDARVQTRAMPVLEGYGVSERAKFVGGSFFDAVPTGSDAYVLKEILHDWDDERSEKILGSVRKAMSPGARLLVMEMVLDDDGEMQPAKLLDLQMMTATHRGRQRTRAEFSALFDRCGLRLNRVVELATPSSIVEAVAV